jgi:hypothetical protein
VLLAALLLVLLLIVLTACNTGGSPYDKIVTNRFTRVATSQSDLYPGVERDYFVGWKQRNKRALGVQRVSSQVYPTCRLGSIIHFDLDRPPAVVTRRCS